MNQSQPRFVSRLAVLMSCLLLLSLHLLYLILTNPVYFPVNTIKISASYQHISRSELEDKLLPFLQHGFFGLSTAELRADLLALPWSERVIIAREWPDTLKITLQEKEPVALWNKQLLTAEGMAFHSPLAKDEWADLPQLRGPEEQRLLVLKTFNELRQLTQSYGLTVSEVNLQANQAWEVKLSNGSMLRLGKQDIFARMKRFCRAYPAVFSDKANQIATVDLRYAHGMAVVWKP